MEKNYKISDQVVKSKVNYAITLMRSVCDQKNSIDRNLYLNNLWKLSGFKSNSAFNKHFEKTIGISVSAYFDEILK